MNLYQLLNHSDYDFYFLVVDPSLSIFLPQLQHFDVITAQKIGVPKPKNSGQLLSHPQTIAYITRHTSPPRQAAIIPFKPSAKLDLICRQHHWTLIANPAALNRRLEDKIKFHQLCNTHHLPTLPHLIIPLSSFSFKSAQQKFGRKLVVQNHFGWAGKGSFLASDWKELAHKFPSQSLVKISPHFDGYTLLNNCCLTRQGVIQSPPALQFTGVRPYTSNPLSTVGRQWPCFAPKNIINQVKTITEKFSSVLTQYHYRGFFGLDFFVHQDQVSLLECNPRLTASFAFYTDLELKLSLTPLFFFHLLEFLDIKYDFDLRQERQRFYRQDLVGTEITPRDKNGKIVNKYQKYDPLVNNPEENPCLKPNLL